MRILTGCVLCLIFGCGLETTQPLEPKGSKPEAPALSEDPKPEATSSPKAPLPEDLRTRKTGSDWESFLGPTGDSKSTEKGIISPWPKKGLRVVWSQSMFEGYAAPAISRGRAFLFDRLRNRARLRAFHSETGKHLWSFQYPIEYEDSYGYSNGPRCYPVVDRDRVYVYGPAGWLHCVRAADGKLIWKVNTNEKFGVIQNFFGVGSTPIIEGDLLIAMVGGSPNGSDEKPFSELTGNGSAVVAFDKYTGKVKYKLSEELASYSSPVVATIDKRRWCFVFARGGLLAFDPSSGKVDFHFPWRAKDFESVNASNPVVLGNKVLISETYGPGGALLEVKPGGYKVLWTDKEKRRDKSLQTHWNTPVYLGGYVYASSGRHTSEAEMRCVEFATGKVMWSEGRLTRSSLLFVDGHLISQGEYGELILFRPNPKKFEVVSRWTPKEAGKEDSEFEKDNLLRFPCWSAPVLSHGLLYVRGKDKLVCLELIPEKK